jgi:hypothetical protein
MPIRIEPKKVVPRKKITLSIPEPLLDMAEKYAEYLGGGTDRIYVIEKILEAFFEQEKDFRRWLDGQRKSAS